MPEFCAAASDLDALWTQFKAENDTMLDLLIELGAHTKYSTTLSSEIRALVTVAKAFADKLSPSSTQALDPMGHGSTESSRSISRLPEIPLPRFDGDSRYWPTFRDRFSSLVDSREELSTIDKFYYLIGCLEGVAADAICGIPVSAGTYDLAWTTLSSRFNRPRLVATSLIDQLLRASPLSQESLPELNTFVSTFTEGLALLNSLRVPDLGSG